MPGKLFHEFIEVYIRAKSGVVVRWLISGVSFRLCVYGRSIRYTLGNPWV